MYQLLNCYWKKSVDVNFLREDKNSSLILAAQNGHEDVVQVLLNKSAHVYLKGQGNTPLFSAAQNGHKNVVQILEKKAEDFSQYVKLGDYKKDVCLALQVATENGHIEVVQMLLRPSLNFQLAYII